jgi:2,3-bisphosphoglycerate-dependent phosphoglycerate mutase
VLTIYTIHHVRPARKGIILGTADDPVDPSLRAPFRTQTRDLVLLASDMLSKSGASVAAYTSSMRRQKETCELLFGNTSIPIVVDERLRQIDNGPKYTGMKFDIGQRDYLNFIDEPFPGGESFRDFARRVREFLEEKSEHYSEHIVLTIGWRLSPAILEHVCRGTDLKAAISNNANISGPFIYR